MVLRSTREAMIDDDEKRFTADLKLGQKMILVVGRTPPPYHGMMTATLSLRAVLDKKRIPYLFLDIADHRTMANACRFELGNILLALRHGFQFSSLLIRRRPEIVYIPISQNLGGFLRDCLFLIPAKLARRKIIVHLHGGYFRQFYETAPSWLRALIRWLFRDISRVIVLGESLRYIFDGLVPKERIVVVPNGLDPSELELQESRALSCQNGRLRILYLGNLIKAKGFIDVLSAVPLVRRQIPQVEFILAGELAYAEEVKEAEQIIEESGTRDFVRMPGTVVGDAKAELLRSSDCLCFQRGIHTRVIRMSF